MSNLNLGKLISSAGVKLPAFTTANLPTGELGLLVFDTTENVVKVYNGNAWVRVTQGGQITATGGTEVVSGNYKYHIYGSPGPSSFVVTSGTGNIEVMVVAGGGCGANNNAGGGGAGGLVWIPEAVGYPVSPGTISVSVGNGGASSPRPQFGDTGLGNSGGNSTFGVLTAVGGGRGGYWSTNGTNQPGGSGGGGNGNPTNRTREPGATGTQPTQPGDSGTYGYGNPGGQGGRTSGDTGGGGGGGAGTAGNGTGGPGSEAGWPGGAGGSGKAVPSFPVTVTAQGVPAPNRPAFTSAVTGANYYAGGGGGGAGGTATPAVVGGVGGGGTGGAAQTSTDGTPGAYGTGGGGGGGDNTQGGSGAPGIVAVRYLQ